MSVDDFRDTLQYFLGIITKKNRNPVLNQPAFHERAWFWALMWKNMDLSMGYPVFPWRYSTNPPPAAPSCPSCPCGWTNSRSPAWHQKTNTLRGPGLKKMKQIRVFFWCYCWMKFAIWVVLLKVPVKMSSKTMFSRAVFTSIHILSSYIHIATLGININRFWINIIPTLSTWIFFVVSHESKSNTVALQAYPQDSQRQAACCGSRWRRAGSWSFYTELSVTGKSIIDTYSIIVVNSSK